MVEGKFIYSNLSQFCSRDIEQVSDSRGKCVHMCTSTHGFLGLLRTGSLMVFCELPSFSSPKAVRVKHCKKFPTGFLGHVISMNAVEKRAGSHTYLLVKSCREIVPTYIGVRSFQLSGSTV